MNHGWFVYRGTTGQVHVIPADDLVPHDAFPTCWCQPSQDPTEDRMWVHHSADGRELEEEHAQPPAKRR